VELQTTDTQLTKSTKALLDCGATGLFMGKDFTEREQIETKKLSVPIPVRNVDGTLNEAGPITEVADMVLHYQNHSERTVFAVTATGGEDIILGLPWLKEHNPEVDWRTEEVKMSRCPA
jgi:Retroviral aspartyl protease